MTDDRMARMNKAICDTSGELGAAMGRMEAEVITLRLVLENAGKGLKPRERLSPEVMQNALEIAKRIVAESEAASSHFSEFCELIAERDGEPAREL